MLGRLTLFMLCLFSLTGCDGQQPSFTYKLDNPQNDDQYSTLHLMPDGALLMVSKRFKQPKHIWNLLRITDWDTSQTRETKLDVDVGLNEEDFAYLSWVRQGDGYDRNDQLLMDPGGNYLVVRLSPDAFDWNVQPDKYPTPRAVLNIINLHGFRLLRRVALADPLLAGGDMGFSPRGAFMVSGLLEQHSATVGGKVTQTNRYAVETLTLPALEPEPVCGYTIVEKAYSALTGSTEERREIEKENDEEYDRRGNEKQAANNACAAKLAPLGFSSLDDVHQNLNLMGRLQKDLDYTQGIPPQSPWGCDFEDQPANRKYDLFDCDRGRVAVFARYRAFRVFRLEDGKQIMDVKVPGRTLFADAPQFSGVLATSRGATYVVLLREGAELEGYRVP